MPRTAVLACFLRGWDCVFIDPALWYHEQVDVPRLRRRVVVDRVIGDEGLRYAPPVARPAVVERRRLASAGTGSAVVNVAVAAAAAAAAAATAACRRRRGRTVVASDHVQSRPSKSNPTRGTYRTFSFPSPPALLPRDDDDAIIRLIARSVRISPRGIDRKIPTDPDATYCGSKNSLPKTRSDSDDRVPSSSSLSS